MSDYIALIRKEDDTSYGVNFPDFPGFVTGGESLDAAMANAREGLAFHIEGIILNNGTLPVARTIDRVRADPDNADAVVALVDVLTAKPKAVRVNITLNADLLRRIDLAAAEAGSTRSGFIATIAADHLARGDSHEPVHSSEKAKSPPRAPKAAAPRP